MRLILSGAAILAVGFVMLSSQPVTAQNLRAVGGPAEVPSPDFQGQQYVDSRGCVFMRAGLGGNITWVARIGQDRRPICNQVSMAEAKARLAESASQVPQDEVALAAARVQPVGKPVGKPMATVASNMRAQSQIGVQTPMVVPGLGVQAIAAPVPKTVAALPPAVKTDSSVSRAARCPAQAPVMQQMALNSGGTVLVCTRGDGGLTGWVSPGYPAGIGGTIQNSAGHYRVDAGQVAFSGNVNPSLRLTAPDVGASHLGRDVQTVIAGVPIANPVEAETQYVAAWKDGRLNPLRGIGTAEGWAMQGQIWTQKAPSKLVAQRPAQIADNSQRVTQSSMSSGQKVAQGASYVQVGTFGNAENVANVAGALSAMGLPVSKSRMTKAGRDLVIVFAGPFDSQQAARSALGMAQQAGFADAFLR